MSYEDNFRSIKVKDKLTVGGDFSVGGSFSFGDASTDSLTVTGLFSQTYSGTADGHLVAGSGNLAAGKDLVRFSTTGSPSSTSNVVAIEQTTGAGAVGSYGLYVNCTGANVEAIKVDAGTVVFDESLSVGTTLGVTGVSTLSGLVKLKANAGADAANALLMGVGTTADPATTSTADKSFMEFRTQSTATSGDSRCLYMRHDLAGVGVSGESLRSFSKVSAAVATARGAHISIDLANAGSVSGFGAGVDAQVMLGAATYSSTLAALNLEINGSDATSDIGVGTTSFMRVVLNGNGTAIGNISDNVSFINFAGITPGSGKAIDTDKTALTGKAGLRVYVDGSLYGYIPIVTGS